MKKEILIKIVNGVKDIIYELLKVEEDGREEKRDSKGHRATTEHD